MTIDLPGGCRLILAGAGLGWFWAVAGAVAIGLLVVLYREERRLVSLRAGLGLLALRMAAAAALVLALFEPIAARTYRETVKGRVLVAVDVSESMATADPGRSAGERERLATTLKLSPGGEPVETMSRREVARRLLEAKDSPVGRLADDHAIEAISFAREAAPASLATIAESLAHPGKPDDPSTAATDWTPALAEALRDGPAPVLGVVLLTDGRQNGPGDPSAAVDRLSARGIPVYPVLVGSTAPPRDVAIASIKAPEAVYKGDVASVEATLKLDGYAGREIAVTLDRPGASPMRQVVRAPADGSRPVVAFRVPMEEVGAVPLTVALAPMEGDVRPDNDRRGVTVQVADDKARVLLVDGEARWEFRYLRNALSRDPRVVVEAVVFHQPTAGSMTTFTYGTELPGRPEGAPDAPDPLGAFDAIVLGDVGPADVPPGAWDRLESYVAERGGTLVLVPGPRHWGTLAAGEAARKLLPVLDPRVVAVDPGATDPAHPSQPPGVSIAPASQALADAAAWPMLQLAPEPDRNRAIWDGLPRLPWVAAGKAKPGAAVLATPRDDEASAVIAAHPYGLGKVLWVGADGTWRWRHGVGDAHHHRFWGQVVRWSAAGKLSGGNPYVRFGPTRPRVAEGEPARLQARISEGAPGVGPDLLVAARVFRADAKTGAPTGEAVAVVPLRAVAGQPRTFEGSAPSLPIGGYAVRLDVPQLAEALHLDAEGDRAPRASLEVAPRETSERVELAAARDPLDRLAAATGGRVLADHEADALSSLLRSLTRRTARTEETPLWDHPAALVLFFAILTVEWVARKRVGLP